MRLLKVRYLYRFSYELRDLPQDILEDISDDLEANFDDQMEHLVAAGYTSIQAERRVFAGMRPADDLARMYRAAYYRQQLSDSAWDGASNLVLATLSIIFAVQSRDNVPLICAAIATLLTVASALSETLPFERVRLPRWLVRHLRFVSRWLAIGAAAPCLLALTATITFDLQAHSFSLGVSLLHIPARLLALLICAVTAYRTSRRFNFYSRKLDTWGSSDEFTRRWDRRKPIRYSRVLAEMVRQDERRMW